MTRCLRERFYKMSHPPEAIDRIFNFNFRLSKCGYIHIVKTCPNLVKSVSRHNTSDPLSPIFRISWPETSHFRLPHDTHKEDDREKVIQNIHSDIYPNGPISGKSSGANRAELELDNDWPANIGASREFPEYFLLLELDFAKTLAAASSQEVFL